MDNFRVEIMNEDVIADWQENKSDKEVVKNIDIFE